MESGFISTVEIYQYVSAMKVNIFDNDDKPLQILFGNLFIKISVN